MGLQFESEMRNEDILWKAGSEIGVQEVYREVLSEEEEKGIKALVEASWKIWATSWKLFFLMQKKITHVNK